MLNEQNLPEASIYVDSEGVARDAKTDRRYEGDYLYTPEDLIAEITRLRAAAEAPVVASDRYRDVIANVCEAWNISPDLRKYLETELWAAAPASPAAPVAPAVTSTSLPDIRDYLGHVVQTGENITLSPETASALFDAMTTGVPQGAAPVAQPTDEREAFEAWHRSKFATKHSTGQPTRDMYNGIYAEKYGPENQQLMWEAWQAARATPAAPLAQQSEPVAWQGGGSEYMSDAVKRSMIAMGGDSEHRARGFDVPLYAGSAPASPVPTTTPMCERKTNDIMQRDGYRKTGYVLMSDDPAARICVSDQGAVSWFTCDQWNWLMHNRDHVEFQWPKPIGAAPASTGPALTDAQIESKFKAAGGQWNGDQWVMEDADLHPFVRSVASTGPDTAICAEPGCMLHKEEGSTTCCNHLPDASTGPCSDDTAKDAAEEFSYSTNEEDYHGNLPTRDAAIEYALHETDDDVLMIWTGRNARFKPSASRLMDWLIESLQEQAYDECGEYAEKYLTNVTDEEVKQLGALILEWVERVDDSNFFTVVDVQKHDITERRAALSAAEQGGKA